MIGNNILTVNQATVTEAVQEYLSRRFVDNMEVKVVCVRPDRVEGVDVFHIEVEGKELPGAKG